MNEYKKVFDLKFFDFLDVLYEADTERFYENVYCSDLMGFALGHIKNENTILCTIINSINTIAVATKLHLPAIIYCENVFPTEEIVEYAKKENISLFISKMNTYETAKKIDCN